MKKSIKIIILLFNLFIYNLSNSQMKEIKVDRIEIGNVESSMSKTKIKLEYVNHDYYVFSFFDNSYDHVKIPEVIILKETPENIYSFYKNIMDNYNEENVKEKMFESGNYKITVSFLGKVPDRSTAILFQKNGDEKIVVTPFLNYLEWSLLFMDIAEKSKTKN